VRILLDNCVHHLFGRELLPFESQHSKDLGWQNLANGSLIREAERSGYRVLVTVDRGMRHQQSFSKRRLSLVSVELPSITLEALHVVSDHVRTALDRIQREDLVGVVIVVTRSGLALVDSAP